MKFLVTVNVERTEQKVDSGGREYTAFHHEEIEEEVEANDVGIMESGDIVFYQNNSMTGESGFVAGYAAGNWKKVRRA